MPLDNFPSRQDIWNELTESTYRNGGTNENSLKQMHGYIFGGSGTGYSRNAFGGFGLPQISNLVATGGNNQINLEYTLGNTGGFDCKVVAQRWEQTDVIDPNGEYNEVHLLVESGISSSGVRTGSISASNGTTYSVRLFAINKFNNIEDYPIPFSQSLFYPVTNFENINPQAPQLPVPSVNSFSWSGNVIDVNFDGSADASGFQAEIRFDGVDVDTGNTSNTNWGTSTNPKTGTWQSFQIPNPSDRVEFRLRATASNFNPSFWTGWFCADNC